MNNERIFVLCLDGATWEFIDPLIREKKLPTFESIIKNGISATLQSTLPPTTIPAWISMFSGYSPEKLGISDFFVFDENFNLKLVNSKLFKGKMLWDRINNKRFVVFNIPGTYPAYKINGIMITDPLGLWMEKSFYPRDIKEKIEKEFKDRIIKLKKVPILRSSRIRHLHELTEFETDLLIWLHYECDPDIYIYLGMKS